VKYIYIYIYIYTCLSRPYLVSFDKNRKPGNDHRNEHTDRLGKSKKQQLLAFIDCIYYDLRRFSSNASIQSSITLYVSKSINDISRLIHYKLIKPSLIQTQLDRQLITLK